MKTLLLTIILLVSVGQLLAGEHRITDYGAIANDGQPDTTAFRAALDAAEQACGGTIVVPRGEFLLDGSVYSNFSTCSFVSIKIRGEIGSDVRVRIGAGQYGLVFTWMNSFQIENVTFLGVQVPHGHPHFTDVGDLFYFAVVENVVIDNCNFYGLAVEKSIVRMASGKLVVSNSRFNGNAAYYSANWADTGAYIYGDNDGFNNAWQNIIVKRSHFADYANYKGQYITKSPEHMTGAYVFTKAQSVSGSAQATGRLFVEDCFFDEGSHTAIAVYNASYVEIKGVGVNVNSTTGSTAVRLTNVKHALLAQNVGDWTGHARPFLTTQNVGFLKLSGLELRAATRFWHNLGNTNMQIEYCEECASKPYVP